MSFKDKLASMMIDFNHESGRNDIMAQSGLSDSLPAPAEFKRETKTTVGRPERRDDVLNSLPTTQWEELMSEKTSSIKEQLINKLAGQDMKDTNLNDDGSMALSNAKPAGGVGTGKKDLFAKDTDNHGVKIEKEYKKNSMGTTALNQPQNYEESKHHNIKKDPKDKEVSGAMDKKSAAIDMAEKIAGLAGKVLKTVGVGAAGAYGGHVYTKKKEDEKKQKMLKNIKSMNQVENKMIRGQMVKKFKTLNEAENRRLAKHFYEAGRSDNKGE